MPGPVKAYPATTALVRVALTGVCLLVAASDAGSVLRGCAAFVCGLIWTLPVPRFIARLHRMVIEARALGACRLSNGHLHRGWMRSGTCSVSDGRHVDDASSVRLLGVVLRSIR